MTSRLQRHAARRVHKHDCHPALRGAHHQLSRVLLFLRHVSDDEAALWRLEGAPRCTVRRLIEKPSEARRVRMSAGLVGSSARMVRALVPGSRMVRALVPGSRAGLEEQALDERTLATGDA